MVSLRGDEDLGLMFQTPEGLGMNDPVPVALVVGPNLAGLLIDETPP
jgi:hypothetical protein